MAVLILGNEDTKVLLDVIEDTLVQLDSKERYYWGRGFLTGIITLLEGLGDVKAATLVTKRKNKFILETEHLAKRRFTLH